MMCWCLTYLIQRRRDHHFVMNYSLKGVEWGICTSILSRTFEIRFFRDNDAFNWWVFQNYMRLVSHILDIALFMHVLLQTGLSASDDRLKRRRSNQWGSKVICRPWTAPFQLGEKVARGSQKKCLDSRPLTQCRTRITINKRSTIIITTTF